MKIIGKKEKYKGRFVKVINYDFLTTSGKKGVWEVVKKKSYKRFVFIFALTKKKEVIVEKIYRVPLESFVIELPAGLSDKQGESEKETAKRELLEETGYLAKKIIQVFEFPAEPGTMANKAVLFFAPDVEYIGRQNIGDAEEIEVLKIPLKKITKFLSQFNKNYLIDTRVPGVISILKEKKLI